MHPKGKTPYRKGTQRTKPFMRNFMRNGKKQAEGELKTEKPSS